MKKFTPILIGFVFIISANINAQKVKVEYDESVDFSKMNTYTFMGWQEDIDDIMNDLKTERVL